MIQPIAQYFIMPGLGIGGTIAYDSYSLGDASVTGFGIGPMISYYFVMGEKKIFPFLSGAFTYSTLTDDDGTNKVKYTMTTIEFMGGAFFKLADHYGIKGGLFFDMDSGKFDLPAPYDESKSGSKFGVAIGFSGFVY